MAKKLASSVEKLDGYVAVTHEKTASAETLEFIGREKPDIVLVDIAITEQEGISLTGEIRSRFPNVQVVMLASKADPALLRRAMRVGACDFLPHTYTDEEFALAIKTANDLVVEYAKQHTGGAGYVPPFTVNVDVYMGRMVAVYSPRGGAGTSQIAANLAIAWAKEGKRVAVIDADLQFGDIALLLMKSMFYRLPI